MDIHKALPSKSKWITAEDVGERYGFRIRDVTMEDVGDGDQKPVVWPEPADHLAKTENGTPKGWVLNKTNASYLDNLYGSETDNWKGRGVILHTKMVEYQGKVVPGIRVDYDTTVERNRSGGADPNAAGAEIAKEPEPAIDDSIPF